MKYELPNHLSDAMKMEIQTRIAIYEAVLAGDVDAIIWYLRNVAGWRD